MPKKEVKITKAHAPNLPTIKEELPLRMIENYYPGQHQSIKRERGSRELPRGVTLGGRRKSRRNKRRGTHRRR